MVDAGDSVGWWTSIAIDTDGNPHISYYDFFASAVTYTRRDGTSWTSEVIDSQDYVGDYTSLALDATGRPHVSYRDESEGALKAAWRDGGPHPAGGAGGSRGGVGRTG